MIAVRCGPSAAALLPGPTPLTEVAATGVGVPVACAATTANVNDTLVFERLFLAAFGAVARIWIMFADKRL